ncbi:MAG: xanthine dehydrogenase family protein subunit M [Chloroflexota bacterium]
MKPAPFAYLAPQTPDDVLAALASAGDEAKLLAGGQSLIPVLNMRLARPAQLIDLGRVAGLAGVQERDGGYAIGAMTRQRAVERDARIVRDVPLLAEALTYVGHPQIRNRGTIGGSIAHADPAAELPAVAVCLGARLTVQSVRGARTICASDLYRGYLETSLAPDELLTEVWFPKAAPGTGSAWLEFARRHGDYALAGVGVQVEVVARVITDARIVLTGVAGVPVRATAAEDILAGARPKANGQLLSMQLAATIEAVRAAIEPEDDVHASAAYRRHLAGVLTDRTIHLAYARALANRPLLNVTVELEAANG